MIVQEPGRGDVALDHVGIAHAALLSAMHGQCFEERWSPQAMGEVLAGAGVFALIARTAEIDGAPGTAPVGFAIARVIGEDAELLSLGVLTAVRRRGIARHLMLSVLERVAAAGVQRVFLEVAEDNFAAQTLYRFHGFRLVGRRPDYYRRMDGGTTAALTLRLVLHTSS